MTVYTEFASHGLEVNIDNRSEMAFSYVLSVMMVRSAKLAEGGMHDHLRSLYLPPSFERLRTLHRIPSKTYER